MTHTTHALRNGLLTALALLAVGSAPAQAAQLRESVPDNWLYVTVTKGDERSSEIRGGLLVCDPARSQALAVRACEELNEADGDIARIPHKEASCPMIYAPVTASARGEWNGRPVEYTQTFSNACAMAAATGEVFALED